MLTGSCHCGAIRIDVPSVPAYLNECGCSICRRYGASWAYYAPAEVRLRFDPDATETYVWGDRTLAFHRCRVCGCVSHWQAFDAGRQRMGINARLFDPADIAGVPRRQSG